MGSLSDTFRRMTYPGDVKDLLISKRHRRGRGAKLSKLETSFEHYTPKGWPALQQPVTLRMPGFEPDEAVTFVRNAIYGLTVDDRNSGPRDLFVLAAMILNERLRNHVTSVRAPHQVKAVQRDRHLYELVALSPSADTPPDKESTVIEAIETGAVLRFTYQPLKSDYSLVRRVEARQIRELKNNKYFLALTPNSAGKLQYRTYRFDRCSEMTVESASKKTLSGTLELVVTSNPDTARLLFQLRYSEQSTAK